MVWERIEPLLPQADGRGRPWRDHRQGGNGVLWRLRTGAPRRDLPERYGPWQTVYERFARWEADGTWASCWSTSKSATTRWAGWSGPSRSTPRSTGPISTLPVPAERTGPQTGTSWRPRETHRSARPSVRSRGGLTTKVHLAVDGRGLPLSIVLTPGNANDATAFAQVLDEIRIPRIATGPPGHDADTGTGRQSEFQPEDPPPAAAAGHRNDSERRTRWLTAVDMGTSAAAHPPSTRRSAATATWSSDASPVSSSSVRLPPGSTNSPPVTGPESYWPR